MLDDTGELPYVLWYQCKFSTCTHLFYNEESKILAHLRDKHNFNGRNGGGGLIDSPATGRTATVPSSTTALSRGGTPLRIKEQHFRPVVATTSSGTDGEDTFVDDLINNNNNNKYATNLSLLSTKRMPRLFHKDDIATNKEGLNQIAIISQQHQQDTRNNNNNNNNANNNNNVKRVVPSIEELKKQLVNSDIDISEIKMRCDDDEEEEILEAAEEEEEEEVQEDAGEILEYDEFQEEEETYNNMNGEEGSFEDPENEDISEDPEEEDESNQSYYYDQELGGHFLFKSTQQPDQDSESNYDDDGIMTPNFGMVDELYRRASLAATTTSSSASNDASSTSTSNSRRRTFHNPCKLCNKIFPSLSMLKKHAKTHLNEDGGSQHICKFCFDYFPSAAGLSKHLRVHTEENPNVCTVCSKSFTSWATLRTHMKIHSGERPFGCDQCGQRFQTKSTLDSHLRIHSGSRPHVCPVCFKSFRTSSPLYRHMRSVHKGLTLTVNQVTVNS